VLANELGLKSDGEITPDTLFNALNVNPEAAMKLREFELAHKTELQRLVIEQERIELERDKSLLEDRQDARARDRAIREAGLTNTRANIMLLAAFMAVIGGWVVLYLGGSTLDSVLVGSVTTVVGMFARNIGTAFDFEFGSSRGSMLKTLSVNGKEKP